MHAPSRTRALAPPACQSSHARADGPDIDRIRDVSHAVAVSVCREAIAEGLARDERCIQAADLDAYVATRMYSPDYLPVVKKAGV